MVKASEVLIGDRLRTSAGLDLMVTRIDHGLLGRPDLLSFVEDSDERWLKMPAPRDGEVELVRPGCFWRYRPSAAGGLRPARKLGSVTDLGACRSRSARRPSRHGSSGPVDHPQIPRAADPQANFESAADESGNQGSPAGGSPAPVTTSRQPSTSYVPKSPPSSNCRLHPSRIPF